MKALTIGGAMIDTIAIIESDRIERMSMLNAETSFLLLEEGRKTEFVEVSTHCGGGAINSAVAMARLGLDVATLIKLGRDDRAEMLRTRLNAEGISTRWVNHDAKAPTGASVLLSSHERNAAVFTFRGANTLLEAADLDDDAFAVDLIYVSNLSNQSADCYPLIIDKAKANGALVAVNPGVRQLSARAGAFHDSLPRRRHPRHQPAGGRRDGREPRRRVRRGRPDAGARAGRAPACAGRARARRRRLRDEPSRLPWRLAQARREMRAA